MKVLIVHRYMGFYGGAENVVAQLSSTLKKKGAENLILSLNSSSEITKLHGDIEIVTPQDQLPVVFRSASLFSSLGIFREIFALRKLIKEHIDGFDVINVHNFPATWALFGLNRKPVVWLCNEPPDFYGKAVVSAAVQIIRAMGVAIDRYIAVSYTHLTLPTKRIV